MRGEKVFTLMKLTRYRLRCQLFRRCEAVHPLLTRMTVQYRIQAATHAKVSLPL